MVPLYKREDKAIIEKFLCCVHLIYKLYAEIVRNRLEEIVEEKGILMENQAGNSEAED